MDWKDILKNVITQGRVKEIGDIDIDIEDDDCLRWLNKLYDIIKRQPEGEVVRDDINDEEDACKVKALWEDKINFEFTDDSPPILLRREMKLQRRAINQNVRNSRMGTYNLTTATGGVALKLYNNPSKGERKISIDSIAYPSFNMKTADFVSKDIDKISKVLKEICNYVNISYDKMTEGMF